MINTLQERASTIRFGAASAALALVVVFAFGVVTTPSAQAQTFTDLYNFTGEADGASPQATLIQDAAGNLYGAARRGGSSNAGVVFKLDTNDTETVLYTFTGGTDGKFPSSGVVRDAEGNLYGTTREGGSSTYGTVFRVNTKGVETVLYNFMGGTDGCFPSGGLVMDAKGDLYGVTPECGASGYGTVFMLSKSGKETILHSFAGAPSDGEYPYYTSVLMDTKGSLYGVTWLGGTSNNGAVYKLSKRGTLTLLHSFAGGTTDGCFPYGTPAMDTPCRLYGTTQQCGASNYGMAHKLSKNGTLTVLHNFAGGATDGAYPVAGVIVDAKGKLYGDTELGGSSNLGAVYEMNKKGTVTLLHSFAGSDGSDPMGDLLRDAQGNLYGTASEGGSSNVGTLWEITP